jgi:DNA-binding HxlR family transcriptional regulator
METISNQASNTSRSTNDVLVREILERVADKWTLLVIDALEPGTATRFTRLQQRIGGVSQKMLTKTLRQLERDGLVTRRVYAEVPPRVDYHLTPLGETLGKALCGVWEWAEAHGGEVERARMEYDRRQRRDGATPAGS